MCTLHPERDKAQNSTWALFRNPQLIILPASAVDTTGVITNIYPVLEFTTKEPQIFDVHDDSHPLHFSLDAIYMPRAANPNEMIHFIQTFSTLARTEPKF